MIRLALAALALLAAPAAADVTASSEAGFALETSITIAAPAATVWDTLKAPARWWNKEHTYSGDSANLYMDTQATGCFCEKVPPRASVEHMRIVYVAPGQMLRLQGGLGPLQAEAASGTLTFTLKPEGSNATRLTMSYVVGGYIRGGAEKLAGPVDQVLSLQLAGLKEAAEAPAPVPAQE